MSRKNEAVGEVRERNQEYSVGKKSTEGSSQERQEENQKEPES